MKVLFYMPDALVGGVRTVTEILTNELSKRGYTVMWLIHSRVYGDKRDFPEGFIIHYLPDQTTLLSDTNVAFYLQLLRDKQIDIIVNQNGSYDGVALIDKAKQLSIPVVSVIHNNPLHYYDLMWDDALYLKNDTTIEKLKRIARILLFPRTKKREWEFLQSQYKRLEQGESTVSVLSEKYVACVKRINPNIQNVVPIANPNTYIRVKNCPKENIVLYVGRLYDASKRIRLLLRIWGKIQHKAKDWKLVIVGEGPDAQMLKDMAAKLKNVEFVGYQNPTEYYQRASILCMTSIFEGFPMVLTEAMQHGCVPIAFDSFPAVKDIINSGCDGEVVKWCNLNDYGERLLHLIGNDSYRNRLAENAKDNVAQYNREIIVDKWEYLFAQLLN